jgi:hypothetical protein
MDEQVMGEAFANASDLCAPAKIDAYQQGPGAAAVEESSVGQPTWLCHRREATAVGWAALPLSGRPLA